MNFENMGMHKIFFDGKHVLNVHSIDRRGAIECAIAFIGHELPPGKHRYTAKLIGGYNGNY